MTHTLRHLKFSLRDLFWLIFSIGIGLGWSVNSWQLKNENCRLQVRASALEMEILMHNVAQYASSSDTAPYQPSIPGKR